MSHLGLYKRSCKNPLILYKYYQIDFSQCNRMLAIKTVSCLLSVHIKYYMLSLRSQIFHDLVNGFL